MRHETNNFTTLIHDSKSIVNISDTRVIEFRNLRTRGRTIHQRLHKSRRTSVRLVVQSFGTMTVPSPK